MKKMRYGPGLVLLLWSVVYGVTGLVIAPLFATLLGLSLVLGLRELADRYGGDLWRRHHG